jgi:exodeoxyribonuclease VII small subunit
MNHNRNFEERLEEAKKILNQLMDPSITLEESLKLYKNGLEEIKIAQKMIEEAKVQIEIIEQSNSTSRET